MKPNLVGFIYNKTGLGWINQEYLLKICPAKITKPPNKNLARKLLDELRREGCLEVRPSKKSPYLRLTKKALHYI